MRIADSTVPLTTGIEPGRPRQVGQVWVLARRRTPRAAAEHLGVAVFSSTCTSRPRAGSKRSRASSKDMSVGHRRHDRPRAWSSSGPPHLSMQCRLEGRADAVQPVVGHRRRQDLYAGGEAVLVGQAARHRDAGHAGQVGRDGGQVVEVHRQRVVDLLPELERRRRRGRRDQDVGVLEGPRRSRWVISVRTFWALP